MLRRKKSDAQPSAFRFSPVKAAPIRRIAVIVICCLATLPTHAGEPLLPGPGEPCRHCVAMEIDRLAALLGDSVLRELICRLSFERYNPQTLANALDLPRQRVMERINTLRGWGVARLISNQWGTPVVEAIPGNGVRTMRRWADRYCPLGDGCGRPLASPQIAEATLGGGGDERSPARATGKAKVNRGGATVDPRAMDVAEMEPVEVVYMLTDSPVGRLLVAATARGVRALYLGDRDDTLISELKEKFPNARARRAGTLKTWTAKIQRYLEGRANQIDVPLDVVGTRFQQQVWAALRDIPRGETRSYGEVARELGDARAARAVARACADNPVSILIPCHRVLRGDGGLGGYHWGVERKRALLDRDSRAR